MRETFIIVAVLHIAAFAIVFLKTGRVIFLIALGGFLATVAIVFTIDMLVETEAEQVQRTLYELGDAMVVGDRSAVHAFIGPDHDKGRTDVNWALGMVDFTKFKINSLEVEINDLTSPPTATARFIGVVSGGDKRGEMGVHNAAFNFDVELEKAGERWLIINHEYSQYQVFKNQPTIPTP